MLVFGSFKGHSSPVRPILQHHRQILASKDQINVTSFIFSNVESRLDRHRPTSRLPGLFRAARRTAARNPSYAVTGPELLVNENDQAIQPPPRLEHAIPLPAGCASQGKRRRLDPIWIIVIPRICPASTHGLRRPARAGFLVLSPSYWAKSSFD